MIIPYPPGGATDILGRLISQKLSPMLGQPVLVENKAGASGNLAFDFVAKSAPDEFMTRIRADVAKFSALFLASDESRMITGAAIPADGGRSAY